MGTVKYLKMRWHIYRCEVFLKEVDALNEGRRQTIGGLKTDE